MAKTATISARIDESVKAEAEDILQQLGIPVSVVINTLYHQIIEHKGIPFSITLSKKPTAMEDLSEDQLNAKLQHSYEQVLAKQGRPLNEVFDALERKHM